MKKTIWMADDDAEIRSAMKMMLNMLGYDLRAFKDVQSVASALLGGEKPDLLFLDINMPEVNGVEFLAVVRQRPEWERLPIIIVSSDNQEKRVEQVFHLGADGYVFKPVNIDELDMQIDSAIQRRKAALERKDIA
jgi:DNA-binding response OmpR family regulator